jgi:hypothetical protein
MPDERLCAKTREALLDQVGITEFHRLLEALQPR